MILLFLFISIYDEVFEMIHMRKNFCALHEFQIPTIY